MVKDLIPHSIRIFLLFLLRPPPPPPRVLLLQLVRVAGVIERESSDIWPALLECALTKPDHGRSLTSAQGE